MQQTVDQEAVYSGADLFRDRTITAAALLARIGNDEEVRNATGPVVRDCEASSAAGLRKIVALYFLLLVFLLTGEIDHYLDLSQLAYRLDS